MDWINIISCEPGFSIIPLLSYHSIHRTLKITHYQWSLTSSQIASPHGGFNVQCSLLFRTFNCPYIHAKYCPGLHVKYLRPFFQSSWVCIVETIREQEATLTADHWPLVTMHLRCRIPLLTTLHKQLHSEENIPRSKAFQIWHSFERCFTCLLV